MTVKAKVLGGSEVEVKNARFVSDVRAALKVGDDKSASVDGVPAEDTDVVREGSRVSFANKPRGGC